MTSLISMTSGDSPWKLEGRPISPGTGRGVVLKLEAPLSFFGGVDAGTGLIIDPSTGRQGVSVKGRVLVFPRGSGSTVGSYILYGLSRNGLAPAAIINERAEPIIATGAILGEIPMVDMVDVSLLEEGDIIEVTVTANIATVLFPNKK